MTPGFVPEHRTLPLLLYQPPPLTHKPGLCHEKLRVGKPEYSWLRAPACSVEKQEALPRDLASGYPHPSLEVSPTPSGVFTKTLLLSATRIDLGTKLQKIGKSPVLWIQTIYQVEKLKNLIRHLFCFILHNRKQLIGHFHPLLY